MKELEGLLGIVTGGSSSKRSGLLDRIRERLEAQKIGKSALLIMGRLARFVDSTSERHMALTLRGE